MFQCHHGVPASCPPTSPRPPSPSSFNATTAFLLRIASSPTGRPSPTFQCHHGVPASDRSARDLETRAPVSMPPRRSCFLAILLGLSSGKLSFNATTAFLLPPRLAASRTVRARFNATTAFLLRRAPRSRSRDQIRFNATTAFLLLPNTCRRIPSGSAVSMPPRRSCFLLRLLPARHPEGRFNATTAFLLPPPPPARCRKRDTFQCHHGVPASGQPGSSGAPRAPVSMPPRRSCFPPDVTPSVRINPVSMPPRRSCFKRVTGSSATSAWSFNATTAFLLRGGLQHCMS